LNYWSSPNPGVNFLSLSDPYSTVTGFQPGNYQIVWNVQELQCQGSDTFNLHVEFYPVAAFMQSVSALTVNLTDNSQYASSWFWDFGDGNSSTAQNPSHTYANNGLYNVCLIATDSCGSDTSCQQVNIFITGNALSLDENWEVFPNPFKDQVVLRWLQGSDEMAKVELLDLNGRLLLEQAWPVQQIPEMQLQLSDLAEGIYFLRVSNGEGKQSLSKLLKLK
jgi:hypothetical protein